jgi:hypothetical protein
MYFKDFNSGAMIQNVVDRAKKNAIKSVLETGQPGLRIQHLLDSIVDEFAENEDLPNTTNPDDWARISGKKGERIVYIRTLVTGKVVERVAGHRHRVEPGPVPLGQRASRAQTPRNREDSGAFTLARSLWQHRCMTMPSLSWDVVRRQAGRPQRRDRAGTLHQDRRGPARGAGRCERIAAVRTGVLRGLRTSAGAPQRQRLQVVELATRNALAIAAGHCFVIFLREGFPVNILNPVKAVPEVCTIYCATANPVELVVAATPRGRAIVGVVDGEPPLGVENDDDVAARRDLLRAIGYKL